jgi:hypothetical protein
LKKVLTQSRLNYLVQRVQILLRTKGYGASTSIVVDIRDFFNKIKSIRKITEIKAPSEIETVRRGDGIVLEWYKSYQENQSFDCLTVYFDGSGKVHFRANYESLDIDVEQTLQLNEDFPHLIMTHLSQFKRPIIKKRYK